MEILIAQGEHNVFVWSALFQEGFPLSRTQWRL